MATTSSRLAVAALDAMTSSGVAFALIHGAERLSKERLSDVDIVVDREAASVISACADAWRQSWMFPVVSWPHSLGGSSVFLCTRNASEGVQLDLLFDPGGMGTYGLRSVPLLETVGSKDSLRHVSPGATLVYQWRKGTVKGQPERLEQVRRASEHIDRDVLLSLSEALTGSRVTALEIFGERPPGSERKARHPVRESARLAHRIRHPIGFWAHASSSQIAAGLTDRFGRFLVSAASIETAPLLRQPSWWLKKIHPLRVRPALVVSWGRLPAAFSPDVVLASGEIEEAAVEVTSAMAARFG